jgi:hypothetical protein
MRELDLEAVLGRRVSISLCVRCRAFWFEPFESLHLSRAATLELFHLISSISDPAGPSPLPAVCVCPRCATRLVHTFDRQRNTRFEYLRCTRDHGRFTRFVDFLKEKDFVRRLSREQISELRRTLPTVRCSGCGASIDLGERSVCEHCGAAVSMLDLRKLMKIAAAGAPVSPGEPDGAPPGREKQTPPPLTSEQVMALLAAARADRERELAPVSLIDIGLKLFSDWRRG